MKRGFSLLLCCVMLVCLILAGCRVQPISEPPVTIETEAPTSEEPTSEPTDPTTAATTAATTTAKPTTKKPTTVTTTAAATTVDWRKDYTSYQLIADNEFQNGFKIKNQADAHVEGTWKNTDSEEPASWEIAQWWTFNSYQDRSGYQSLWNTRRLDTPANVLSDGIETLTYNDVRRSMSLRIDTYDFYGGEGHTDNSGWPHLLLEQGQFADLSALDPEIRKYYTLAVDKMILRLKLRMTEFEHLHTDDGINAFQLVSFYYVKSLVGGGFTWFSVPLFDDRGYSDSTHSQFVMDYGTGSYMYGVPQICVYDNTDLYGLYNFMGDSWTPTPSEEWMIIELDLKPWLDSLAKYAMGSDSLYHTYPGATSLSDLVVNGVNMGYEVHGSYKCTFEFCDYSLTSYIKK